MKNFYVQEVVNEITQSYVDLKPFLNYKNAYQLLIMVILSARTRDEIVNSIADNLFTKYPSFEDLSKASLEELELIIYPTGFYKEKTKNLIFCAKRVVEVFASKIPKEMHELLSLSGVGRKTANVILGALYSKPVIIVDTHFSRVVNRLGLVSTQNPQKIEFELKKIIEPVKQYSFSMGLNKHGRVICKPKPDCKNCILNKICPKILK